jgi:putative addiction module component (TIGR02574 family)
MSMDLAALGLDRLSPDEKLELAGLLWDSAVSSESPGSSLTAAQRDELIKRVADARAKPEDYVEWEEALANTQRRLSN